MFDKKTILLFSILIISISGFSQQYINLNSDWKFHLGDIVNANQVSFSNAGWREIQIPHDWAIEQSFNPDLPANTGKLPWKGVGWYRKYFTLNANNVNKNIYILFDGVMAFPEVFINGKLAGKWDYGYNSFYLDISSLVRFDTTNLIAIKVDTRQHESRWYPGAGIYRKVQLLITNQIHHEIWGTYIQTPSVTRDSALIHVYSSINNFSENNEEVLLESKILSPDGELILTAHQSQKIMAGTNQVFEQWFTVRNPEKWDIDNPVLYTMQSTLKLNGKEVENTASKFGIRSFEFTGSNGFVLNGKRLQLKGVNLHHDHGPLGTKFYIRAMERQLVIMKEMGVNSIRNSHNVAAPELLQLCDSLGLLLYNEAFDKWDAKADLLPGMDFNEFADRNISNWVKRDRNHPCVILWSVGNEMGDIQYNINSGFEKLNTMIRLVKQYDPSRPVNMVCDAKNSAPWRHFDYYDVHAWNYGRRYLPARHLDTTKSVIISESASTLSTRGFYEFPLPVNKTDFTKSLQVSSYDLNAPLWAEVADDDFMWQSEDTYVAGEFVWTGFDYLGEPTPYNDEAVKDGFITQEHSAKSSYFGIVDMCGIPKDRYFLYKSHWKPEEPMIHILPHWNWEGKEGEKIPVFVYTAGDCAELFLNGISQGIQYKKPDSDKSIERYRLMWMDVIYQTGELKVVAYKNEKEIGMKTIQTSGEPYALKLTPDRILLKADGTDLSYILVEALDKKGNLCPLADNLIHFEITGPAVIEGVGNGNPQSLEPFIADRRKLFNGKAMLIIRSLATESEISVSATASKLKKAVYELRSEK